MSVVKDVTQENKMHLKLKTKYRYPLHPHTLGCDLLRTENKNYVTYEEFGSIRSLIMKVLEFSIAY